MMIYSIRMPVAGWIARAETMETIAMPFMLISNDLLSEMILMEIG